MDIKGSLPHSKEPATFYYPEQILATESVFK
jgi:hypothetical protein